MAVGANHFRLRVAASVDIAAGKVLGVTIQAVGEDSTLIQFGKGNDELFLAAGRYVLSAWTVTTLTSGLRLL